MNIKGSVQSSIVEVKKESRLQRHPSDPKSETLTARPRRRLVSDKPFMTFDYLNFEI